MNESKRANINGSASHTSAWQNIHLASATHFDTVVYDGFYYDSMCLSCRHWTERACGSKSGSCEYEALENN